MSRELAHLLDTSRWCVGWLWPLWDSRKPHLRRFAAADRSALVGTDGVRPDIRRRGRDRQSRRRAALRRRRWGSLFAI